MLPRERVECTMAFEEPDIVPWGEHSIDYNTYEMVLGRESFVQGKFKLNKALWDGRRDEIVESEKHDRVDLADALGFDIITVGRCPAKGHALGADRSRDLQGARRRDLPHLRHHPRPHAPESQYRGL